MHHVMNQEIGALLCLAEFLGKILAYVPVVGVPGHAGRPHQQTIRQRPSAQRSVGSELGYPFSSGTQCEARELGNRESHVNAPSKSELILGGFFEGAQHFRCKPRAIIPWIQAKQDLVGSFHRASAALSRAKPARVSCFMRSNSICNCLRPTAVSR